MWERRERLVEFFKSNDTIWKDIVEEIKICDENAVLQMKQRSCQQREYWAGYCNGLSDVIHIKAQSQLWDIPKKI